MTFYGEQGPFHDGIAGATDESGWAYEPAHDLNLTAHPLFCFYCGEQYSRMEGDLYCWHCGDPVPPDWARLHDDALFLTTGAI